MPAPEMELLDESGDLDIYVFDQLLRGRIRPGMRVFDAGCGGGRNLVYLMRRGYDLCRLGAELVDPLKATVVHRQRSTTTWVMRRL